MKIIVVNKKEKSAYTMFVSGLNAFKCNHPRARHGAKRKHQSTSRFATCYVFHDCQTGNTILQQLWSYRKERMKERETTTFIQVAHDKVEPSESVKSAAWP